MKQSKLVLLPPIKLDLRRLVLSLAYKAVESREEKCQELELKGYNDCLGEEPWEPMEKASVRSSKEAREL